jgi:hypothetical protein
MGATFARRARVSQTLTLLIAMSVIVIMGWPGAAATRVDVAAPSPLPGADRPAAAAVKVVLYGDSLAWEAQDSFRATLAARGITDVTTKTLGGTAICDWLPQMPQDRAALHPDAVVVEFSGNALTPCMEGDMGVPLSGLAFFEKYADDAQQVLRIFGSDGTAVYFAGAPVSLSAERTHDPNTGRLNRLYGLLAHSYRNSRYVDAGTAVTVHGHWTKTLPCLPTEPCSGDRDSSGRLVNIVRAPDGTHFCPTAPAAVRGVTNKCRVWSSGAYRYGIAMASLIVGGRAG